MGMIGELDTPMSEHDFLAFVKQTMKCEMIKHSKLLKKREGNWRLVRGAGIQTTQKNFE